jgi:hypothetical protein
MWRKVIFDLESMKMNVNLTKTLEEDVIMQIMDIANMIYERNISK